MAKTKTPKNKTKKHGGFIPPTLKKSNLSKKSKSKSPNSKKSVKSAKKSSSKSKTV